MDTVSYVSSERHKQLPMTSKRAQLKFGGDALSSAPYSELEGLTR